MAQRFDPSDPRAVRSRAALLAAALRLAEQAPATLTVGTLIDAAAVSRSTFYAHFDDLDDVYFALLDESLDGISADDLAARSRGDDPAEIALRGHARVIRHLAEHRALFASVLAPPKRARVRARFTRRLADLFIRSVEASPAHPDRAALELWALYTAGGFTAAVAEWLTGEVDVDEAELTRLLTSMSPPWFRSSPSSIR
jgi:AcrR family transcriptional regulator